MTDKKARIRKVFLGIGVLIFVITISSVIAWYINRRAVTSPLSFPKQRIVVGCCDNFPPFELRDENGNHIGYARDVSMAVAKELGVDIEYRTSPRWVEVVEWLKNGEVDLIHLIAYSPERDEYFDFTIPHTLVPEVIFVRSERLDIHGLHDLEDKQIGAVRRHITHEKLLKHEGLDIVVFEAPREGVEALLDGKVDAFAYPQFVFEYLAQQMGREDEIKIVGEPLGDLRYCMAVREGEHVLLSRLDWAIKRNEASGQRDEIAQRWFGRKVFLGLTREEVLSLIGWAVFGLLVASLGGSAYISVRYRLRKAEAALRHNLIFQHMDDSVILTSLDGKITDWNPGAERMFGHSREEILRRRPDFLLAPEGSTELFETIIRGVQGDGIWSGEIRAVRKDGSQVVCSVRMTTLRNEKGDIIAYVSIIRDITERKRAEEVLRKRTEEVELLYEAGQQLSQTLDIDTIYDRLHDLVSGIMDCDSLAVSSFDPEDKLICCAFAIIEGNQQDVSHLPPLPLNPEGQGTQSLVIHTGRSLLIRDYQGRVKTSEKAYYVDEEGEFVDCDKAPDDADVTRSGLIVPVKLEGRVVGIIQVQSYRLDAYTEDDLRILESLAHQIAVASNNALLYQQAQDEIVQRKRVEEERARLLAQIHGQAQQVQQIIDTVPEGVLLLDADGQVILANPLGRKDLAALANASVGNTLTHLGDRPLAELLTSPYHGFWHEVALEGPPPRVFEIIAKPIETGPTPGGACPEPALSVAEGPVEGACPACPERSRGEPVEGACPEPVEGWVLVIRDMTREREFQRYSQQQERLATVGQLAAGIAHDFNNIMATIVLYAQMLSQTEGLSPRSRERLATINQQAMYATHLTQQILDFSRRAVLERRPLNLLLLLQEQIKLLERTLPENIEIALAYGPDEYTVNADPTRMQQAMMNLALNARDAMPAGGNLRFGLEWIQVQPGESPPLPEMKTGEWVQVTVADTGSGIPPDILPRVFDPFFTTKEPGKGSGLGLAQVHGIVKQHEGEIDVETQVGQGTTFTIYLPALPVHPAEAPTLEMEALAKGKGETILVVEDNAVTRQALVESLELLNYRTLEAADGREALEILERQTSEVSSPEIVLVLSDVVMPGMGGVALFHALRQRNLAVKVVLMTGHPLVKDMERLRTQGLSDWLPKPPSLEQLAEVVARALES